MMAAFGGESIVQRMRTQLPVTRVRRICKIDREGCSIISAEAVQLLTLATERFVGLLAKAAYGQAMFDKRKTLQLKDLEFCIKSYDVFNFLDGALDGWPEANGAKKLVTTGGGDRLSAAVLARMSLAEGDIVALPDNEEEQEIEDFDVDGLSDEIFGYDESLLQETVQTNSPFDRDVSVDRQRDETATVDENNGIVPDAEMHDDSAVPETEPVKAGIFGHYGYYLATNSATNDGTTVDLTDEVQMDDEMQETQALDSSTEFDLLNRSGVELGTDIAASLPQTESLNTQDIFRPSPDGTFARNT